MTRNWPRWLTDNIGGPKWCRTQIFQSQVTRALFPILLPIIIFLKQIPRFYLFWKFSSTWARSRLITWFNKITWFWPWFWIYRYKNRLLFHTKATDLKNDIQSGYLVQQIRQRNKNTYQQLIIVQKGLMIYCSKSLFYGLGLRCLTYALLRIFSMLSMMFLRVLRTSKC